jgi:hypothetical protein
MYPSATKTAAIGHLLAILATTKVGKEAISIASTTKEATLVIGGGTTWASKGVASMAQLETWAAIWVDSVPRVL